MFVVRASARLTVLSAVRTIAFVTTLTANDLKTRGIAAIEESLAQQPEAMISVRGRNRFVVMELAQYQYLRECELEAALAQTKAEVAAGQYVIESAEAHVARMQARLEADQQAPPLSGTKRRPAAVAAASGSSRRRQGR